MGLEGKEQHIFAMKRKNKQRKKHRRWKPYTELSWEQRRRLVEREEKQANTVNSTSPSAHPNSSKQMSPLRRNVAVPLAPRLTGSDIMDEREKRLGLPNIVRTGCCYHDFSGKYSPGISTRQSDSSNSELEARYEAGIDSRTSSASFVCPSRGEDICNDFVVHSPASSFGSSSEEEEFEEAFEECMNEDYDSLTRQELIKRLEEKDKQLASLEQRLTNIQQPNNMVDEIITCSSQQQQTLI